MGFINSLFEIHHRAVGARAKDMCVDTSSTSEEFQFMNEYGLDSNMFIPARNALLIMLINLFYMLGIKQAENNPEATFDISQNFFQGQVSEYFHSLPDSRKHNMQSVLSATSSYIELERVPVWLYEQSTGKDFTSLSDNEQQRFADFSLSYISRVSSFFEKEAPKLLK